MEYFDYQIIANCLAGKGQAEGKLKSIKNFLDLHKRTYTCVEIRKPTPISQIPLEGNVKITKGIICIGGDGTVSETIEFMLKRKWDFPIFMIPTGTANFIANSVDVTTDISYDRLFEGKIKTYDLGVCQNLEEKDYFLVGIGLGYEQKFLKMAKQSQKKFLGKLSYFLAALVELFRLNAVPYRIILDGKELNIKSAMLTILNLKPKITKFLPLFSEKEIKPDDGLLDIFFIEHKNYLYSFLGILFFHVLGSLNFGMVERFKAKEIEIKSPNPQTSQIDGEFKGQLPLKISLIPEGAKFLV